jgi:hypothetical protein
MTQKATLLAVLLVMLVFVVVQYRGGLFGARTHDAPSAAFLSEIAADFNKHSPKPIDQETEIASITALEGVLVFNYRLVNRAAMEVDADALLASLRPRVTKGACATPETQKLLRQYVTLRYSYADRSGGSIGSFDVTLADCGA